ncbi:MAG: response regulator [Verrucomicrobia bacterium]|nr:response regulator [Verrucomicrobiota bacterium]
MKADIEAKETVKRGTVLVVEDEAIVAADLANKLGHLGYEIVGPTPRGEEAIALAQETRPNLVLMDIRLQGRLDGVEAAAQIRRDCDLPVIFLTAHSDAATLERAKTAEPFGYILKPFEERELDTTIEMARYKHEAEHRLRESEEQLRLITDATPALIGYVDAASLEYRFANREYETWFGRPRQTVVDKTMIQVLGRAAVDQLRPHLERALTGVPVRFEIEASYASGARWVDVHYIPRREAGGRVAGVYELVQDITQRKRTEEALHESREHLALALAGARMGTFEWNVRTKEILWSAYHYVLLGYRPGEVAASFEAWQQRVLPEDRPDLLRKVERALDGTEEYQAEYRVRWPDGSIHWLWVMGRFLIGQRGQTERMLGVTMDITERKPNPEPS